MHESGTFYGISGSVGYCGKKLFGPLDFARVEGTVARGDVGYTSTSSGTIPVVHDSMVEARLLTGGSFKAANKVDLTPFTGFGYRKLNDNGSGLTSSSSSVFYDRESNYYYSPIGIEVSGAVSESWKIAGTLEYDLLWWGMQYSNITDANNAYYTYSDNLKNRQHSGYGIRASVKAIRKVQSMSLAFEPFVRYWSIDRSDPMTIQKNGVDVAYGEPQNTTTQYGLAISMIF